MNKLRAMQVFQQVCRQGSFSAAAESLELANSAVSRQVTELENWLGVKLLYRTTRSLSLTDDGRIYLEKISGILASVDELESQADASQHQVRGTLRITAPLFLGRLVFEPILPEFLRRYPDVSVSLLLVDRFVDLISEGFDLALRVTVPTDSNLISRRLANMRLTVVAAPEYLEQYGTPHAPADLKDHECLYDSVAQENRNWFFSGPDGEISIAIPGKLAINNGEMIRNMATRGMGIAKLPDFFVNDAITSGDLVPVLGDYLTDVYPISIYYPFNRHMNHTLRTFIDFVFGRFASDSFR